MYNCSGHHLTALLHEYKLLHEHTKNWDHNCKILEYLLWVNVSIPR